MFVFCHLLLWALRLCSLVFVFVELVLRRFLACLFLFVISDRLSFLGGCCNCLGCVVCCVFVFCGCGGVFVFKIGVVNVIDVSLCAG